MSIDAHHMPVIAGLLGSAGLMLWIFFTKMGPDHKPQRETLNSLMDIQRRAAAVLEARAFSERQLRILKMQQEAAEQAARYTTDHQCNGCGFWSQIRTCPKCRRVHVEQIKHITLGSSGVRSWI